MGDAGGVDIFQQTARFDDCATGMDFLDRVHLVHVQDAAARQRHRLPVIAGARAACGDGDVMGVAGFQDLDHLGLGLGRDDEIADHPIEPRLEHGRIPEKIAAFRFDGGGVGVNLQMRQGGQSGGDIRFHHCVLIR